MTDTPNDETQAPSTLSSLLDRLRGRPDAFLRAISHALHGRLDLGVVLTGDCVGLPARTHDVAVALEAFDDFLLVFRDYDEAGQIYVDRIDICLRAHWDDPGPLPDDFSSLADEWLEWAVAPDWRARGYDTSCTTMSSTPDEHWLLLQKPWRTLDELVAEIEFLATQTTYHLVDADDLRVEEDTER